MFEVEVREAYVCCWLTKYFKQQIPHAGLKSDRRSLLYECLFIIYKTYFEISKPLSDASGFNLGTYNPLSPKRRIA